MKYTLLFLSLLLVCGANAQSRFTRIYQQDTAYTSNYFFGYCSGIQPTADGGYLLQYYSGQVLSDGSGYDFPLVIKTDSSFVPQWKKRLFGALVFKSGSIFDQRIIFDTCMSLEKRDLNGNILWQKSLGVSNGNIRIGSPIYANGKVRMKGGVENHLSAAFYQAVIVDIDSTGALLAANTIDGDTSSIQNIFTDDSGNYYLITTNLFGGNPLKITKIKADNTLVWSNAITSEAGFTISGLAPLPDGSMLFGGTCMLHSDTERNFLIKLNPDGNIVWQKMANRPSRMGDMQLQKNGTIVIVSGIPVTTRTTLRNDDVIAVDTAADVLWTRNMDIEATTWPYYSGISVPYSKGDNNLYFAALSLQPYAAMLLNTDTFGIGHCASAADPIMFLDNALFSFTSSTMSFAPISLNIADYVLADSVLPQTYADSCDYTLPLSSGTAKEADVMAFEVYPNPANDYIYIQGYAITSELTIYSMAGRQMYKQTIKPGGAKIDVSGLANGTYMVRIYSYSSLPVYRKLVIIN